MNEWLLMGLIAIPLLLCRWLWRHPAKLAALWSVLAIMTIIDLVLAKPLIGVMFWLASLAALEMVYNLGIAAWILIRGSISNRALIGSASD